MNELELLSRYRRVEPMDSALIDAAVQAILDSPDGAGGASHGSSSPGRRRVSRLAVVGLSVAAAVATTAVVVGAAGGSSSPRPAPTVAPAPNEVLTGYVIQHSLAALETSSGYVERVVQRDTSGVRISWRGPNELLVEVPGQSATLWTWAAGVDTVLNIDYRHHTWSRSTFPAPTPPPNQIGGPPPPGAYIFSQKGLNGPQAGATSIAALFRQPGIAVIGTATIDGTLTYELKIPALEPNGTSVPRKGLIAWVNTRTYLPVRITRDTPSAEGPNNGTQVTIPSWTQDFTWQPATPQALAVFDLKPPAPVR